MSTVYRSASEVRVWLGEDPAIGEMLSITSTVSSRGDLRIKDLFDAQLCPQEVFTCFSMEKRADLLKNEYWSRT